MSRVKQNFLDTRAFSHRDSKDCDFRKPAPDYDTQILAWTGENHTVPP